MNDSILAGPDLLTSLHGVLLRFGKGRIALCSDIKDMFLQLRVAVADMPALRFLYRDSPVKEIDVYQCLRRPSGERSTPACANYAVKINAEEHRERYPEAAEAVKRNLYFDDSLNSVDEEIEAVRLRRDLSALMKLGGFQLTKWLSNSETVLNDIPESERAEVKQLTHSGIPNSRTLGVVYCSRTDAFYISISASEPARTPRAILSRVSSIWDPHGWLSAFTIRICQRSIFLKKYGWNEVIEENDLKEWRKWEAKTKDLQTIAISRCFRQREDSAVGLELHLFSDSSQTG